MRKIFYKLGYVRPLGIITKFKSIKRNLFWLFYAEIYEKGKLC